MNDSHYRVIRKGVKFYPQKRGIFFGWNDFTEFAEDDYSFESTGGYTYSVSFTTMSDAIEYIRKVGCKNDEEVVWEGNL